MSRSAAQMNFEDDDLFKKIMSPKRTPKRKMSRHSRFNTLDGSMRLFFQSPEKKDKEDVRKLTQYGIDLMEKNSDLQEKLEQMTNKKEKYKKKFMEVKNQLISKHNHKAELDRLDEEYSKTLKENRELKLDVNMLKFENEKLKNEIEVKATAVDDVIKHNKQLSKKQTDNDIAIKKYQLQIEQLRQSEMMLSSKNQRIQKLSKEKEFKLEKIKLEKMQLSKELKDMQKELSRNNQMIVVTKQKHRERQMESNKTIEELEKMIKNQQKSISKQKKEIETRKKKIKKLKSIHVKQMKEMEEKYHQIIKNKKRTKKEPRIGKEISDQKQKDAQPKLKKEEKVMKPIIKERIKKETQEVIKEIEIVKEKEVVKLIEDEKKNKKFIRLKNVLLPISLFASSVSAYYLYNHFKKNVFEEKEE